MTETEIGQFAKCEVCGGFDKVVACAVCGRRDESLAPSAIDDDPKVRFVPGAMDGVPDIDPEEIAEAVREAIREMGDDTPSGPGLHIGTMTRDEHGRLRFEYDGPVDEDGFSIAHDGEDPDDDTLTPDEMREALRGLADVQKERLRRAGHNDDCVAPTWRTLKSRLSQQTQINAPDEMVNVEIAVWCPTCLAVRHAPLDEA